MKGSKRFFFGKKEPKNFFESGAWALAAPQPEADNFKVFLLLFVHKKKGFLSPAWTAF
jgi:hypothetical protein